MSNKSDLPSDSEGYVVLRQRVRIKKSTAQIIEEEARHSHRKSHEQIGWMLDNFFKRGGGKSERHE